MFGQTRFLVVSLCLFVFVVQVNAEDLQSVQIKYKRFEEPEGKEYQQFLPSLHGGQWYWIRMMGIGNVDDTPNTEEVVLITLQNSEENSEKGREPFQYWQAFLLVCARQGEVLKKKYLLEIFDNTTKEFFTEKPYPPLVFKKSRDWQFFPSNGKIELVDLNYDGILDVFIQLWYTGGSYSPFCVEVVSFQNGDLRRIFTSFAGVSDYSPQVLDIDGDGLYEISIPDEIYVEWFEHAASPPWVSLYEWDGKEYILNNQKFYSRDIDILIKFLQLYSYRLRWYSDQLLFGGLKTEMYFEDYEFYLGMIYYYRENWYTARDYLERIVQKAKSKNYIREAQTILARLAETGNPDFAPHETK